MEVRMDELEAFELRGTRLGESCENWREGFARLCLEALEMPNILHNASAGLPMCLAAYLEEGMMSGAIELMMRSSEIERPPSLDVWLTRDHKLRGRLPRASFFDI
jgi:hypothetical protein